jgi:hypothetical protein
MTVNGQSGAILVRVTKRSSPVRGYSVTFTYECTNAAAAEAIYSSSAFAGAEVTWTDGPKPVVEAVYGADTEQAEVPQDEYTLSANKVQKDFLDADHDLVNALNVTNRDELRKYIQDPTAYVAEGKQFSSTVAGGTTSDPSWVAVTKLWTLVQAGLKHIEVNQPVFRLSRFVSRGYTTAFNASRLGLLLTTQTMKADSFAPADFLVPIDSMVAQFRDPIRADGLDLVYAWKKSSPNLNGSGRNKRRIDQEYEFGLWAKDLYGDPV